MNKQFVDPLEQVFPRVVAAIDEWVATHTPEQIKADIFSRLDKAQQEIVLKLLGFDKSSWDNKWELDHCNGRAGNSAAGTYLVSQSNVVIKEWLSQIQLPKMTAAFRKTIEKQLQSQFERDVSNSVYQVAQTAATEALNQIKKEVCTTDIVEKYFKAHELLNNPQ